jgi:hypothetical protein
MTVNLTDFASRTDFSLKSGTGGSASRFGLRSDWSLRKRAAIELTFPLATPNTSHNTIPRRCAMEKQRKGAIVKKN